MISSRVRTTIRPPGKRIVTVSTVLPSGNWNDEVFNVSVNDFSLLSTHEIEGTPAYNGRAYCPAHSCASVRKR